MRKEKKPPKVSLATECSATRVTKTTTKKKVRPTSASSANRRRAQTAPKNIVTGGLGDSDSGGGSPPRFRSSSSYMNGTANSLNSTTIHRGEYTSLVANHSKPKPRPGESYALLRCYYVRFFNSMKSRCSSALFCPPHEEEEAKRIAQVSYLRRER